MVVTFNCFFSHCYGQRIMIQVWSAIVYMATLFENIHSPSVCSLLHNTPLYIYQFMPVNFLHVGFFLHQETKKYGQNDCY